MLNPFLIFATIIACCLPSSTEHVSASDLFVTINNLEATIGNSLLNVSFKSDSSIHSLYRNGKNLVDKVSRGTGYIDWNGGKQKFVPTNLTLVELNEDLVHIRYLEKGSTSVLNIEFHIIILSNVSTMYHYIKASNPSTETITFSEFRTVHRFSASIMPQVSNGVRHAVPPLQEVLDTRPTIQDSTWQLEDGTYYTKYEYVNYIHETPWFGTFGGGFGAWVISPSREYHSGGPLKQDLLVHQDALICNYLTSAHFGTPNLNAIPGWSKFYGPWVLYFNEGSNEELLEDVARQSIVERSRWPYQWVNDAEYPLSRGALTGRVTGQPKAALVLYSSLNETFDLQTKGYSYNTETTEEGYFNLTNIRPGMYRLVAYPLAGYGSESLFEMNINITEGIQDAGVLNLPEPTGILWAVGETNRRADNFRYSDEKRNFYWQLITPVNLTFVIGTSNITKDWYYAQSHSGTWKIVFSDVPDAQSRTLRIAIAGACGSHINLQVLLNDVLLGDFKYTNDGSVYRQSMQSGNFYSIKLTIPAEQIVNGENIISLMVKSGKFMDLTSNNITSLNETSLSNFPHLEELILSDNKLENVHSRTFAKNIQLKRLILQNCGLKRIPSEALKPLVKLQTLQVGNNALGHLEPDAFQSLPNLRSLRIDGNQLHRIPTESLATLTHLEVLNLGNNQLPNISVGAFPTMGNLLILLLKRNQIVHMDEDAFANLSSLRILELDDNFLTQIPLAITKLPELQELSISGNRIKYIAGGVLQQTPALVLLELKGNPLMAVDSNAFSHLPRLRKLILSEARELSTFPNLNGTSALELLKLDRAGLTSVPASLCHFCPKLKSLDVKSNKLTMVPDVNHCKEMRVLDLASNLIRSIESKPFCGMRLMHDLLLANNQIQYIPYDAFYNLSKLQVLDMENNQISFIHPDAFLPISSIEDLNLGNNVFPHLPSAGLERLLHLKTFNNPNLREFPPPEEFPRIQSLVLSYAYHCCAFLPLVPSNPPPPAKDLIIFPDIDEIDWDIWNRTVDLWPSQQNMTKSFGSKFEAIWENIRSDFTYPGNFPSYMEEYISEEDIPVRFPGDSIFTGVPGRIQCLPSPGPFLPCQDLFDWWTLRCGVWVVFLCSLLGNGTVVFVLIFSRSKMDVPRFLVCNLAAADFFMGIYLGFLAVVDASTLGEFRMYAIPWQMSPGCQLAGFLGVLSSELSVYTLAVITLERNYAITHAMHLNKRLSLRHAGYIMICGWSFAIGMAVLPLFSVSDYRKFAVCLPFEIKDTASLTYVVFLMFINGVAFLILMGCYLKMYCAIRGSQAWNSNDSRIAKRMALLVFTDFLCWSPIAFFSLTASFGLQLISLEQAKVFTVFVLPFNSCCNPFLYAILTKQFKKDCVMICKAIEESRVTRGIGRCRHSSNFSNRQTPANTGSLADRSSRENKDQQVPPCTCNQKLLGEKRAKPQQRPKREGRIRKWLLGKARWLFCVRKPPRHRRPVNETYTYQIAEIQQKQHKRASSVSSSENFSSSRSDSWRYNHPCGIPLRLLDPKRRASSWIVTRKTSQDSNLSSSRNDSSGSAATTASTSTWRMSRSSGSSEPPKVRVKPRLTRQYAFHDDSDPPGSPGRLTVRFLTTIPSAAENSMQIEEEQSSIAVSPAKESEGSSPMYAILHTTVPSSTPVRRQSIVTLHPASDIKSLDSTNHVQANTNNIRTEIVISNGIINAPSINTITSESANSKCSNNVPGNVRSEIVNFNSTNDDPSRNNIKSEVIDSNSSSNATSSNNIGSEIVNLNSTNDASSCGYVISEAINLGNTGTAPHKELEIIVLNGNNDIGSCTSAIDNTNNKNIKNNSIDNSSQAPVDGSSR